MKILIALLAMTTLTKAFAGFELGYVLESIKKFEAEGNSIVVAPKGTYTIKGIGKKNTFNLKLNEHVTNYEFGYYPKDPHEGRNGMKYVHATSAPEAEALVKKMYAEGIDFNSLNSTTVYPMVLDGVKRDLTCYKNSDSSGTENYETSCSAAYYTGIVPGLPGLNKKKNRFVRFYFGKEGEILPQSDIYQVWMVAGIIPKSQEMNLEVIDFQEN